MYINHLKLTFFKNHQSLDLNFSKRIISIVGLNGLGKTNLLDAIYYLSFCKSAFTTSDNQNIFEDAPYFFIDSRFLINNETVKIATYFERNKKKILKVDGNECKKYLDHIGKILLIMSTPYDIEIIRDTSSSRRKWIDSCISLADHHYLDQLMNYQKILKERNTFLKQYDSQPNIVLLETYDEQIIELSLWIFEKRKKFIEEVLPFFVKYIHLIVGEKEKSFIEYQSDIFSSNFKNEFLNSRKKDFALQYTSMGCHRDDLHFTLNDQSIKKIGSQGQQKSFLLALRMAQYEYIYTKKHQKPILLFDDVFDKLDDERISKLVEIIQNDSIFGQVFITDARKERTQQFFNSDITQWIELK